MKKIINNTRASKKKKRQATGDAEDLKEEERFSQVDQRVERIKQTQREMYHHLISELGLWRGRNHHC